MEKKLIQNNIKNKTSFQPDFGIFYLMRLIGKSYFSHFAAIFTDFILPIIIMSILYSVMDAVKAEVLVPGVLISPTVSSAFFSFAILMTEWKNSVLLKRIKISKLSYAQFFISFVAFFFMIGILGFFVGFGYTLLLEQLGVKALVGVAAKLDSVNWGYALLGVSLLIITALILGFIVSILFSSVNAVVGVGLTLFLVQAFVLGYYLPLNMSVSQQGMRIFSYLTPFYGPSRIFQVAWLSDWKVNLGNVEKTIIEDWEIFNLVKGEVVKFPVNFHKSYWSLILLSFAWISFGLVGNYFLNRWKKE